MDKLCGAEFCHIRRSRLVVSQILEADAFLARVYHASVSAFDWLFYFLVTCQRISPVFGTALHYVRVARDFPVFGDCSSN